MSNPFFLPASSTSRTSTLNPERVGFHNLVVLSDLQVQGCPDDCHAARSYSCISPPRTFRCRIRADARPVGEAVVLAS